MEISRGTAIIIVQCIPLNLGISSLQAQPEFVFQVFGDFFGFPQSSISSMKIPIPPHPL